MTVLGVAVALLRGYWIIWAMFALMCLAALATDKEK